MRLHKSGEDYPEAIRILEQKHGYVRSSDVAEQMNVTKPSLSNATRLLKEGGFLTMGGIGVMIVSVFGLATQKEKKHPAVMLIGSVLCAVFAGLCWRGYRKR